MEGTEGYLEEYPQRLMRGSYRKIERPDSDIVNDRTEVINGVVLETYKNPSEY